MTIITPVRSADQRMAALAQANEVRALRAEQKNLWKVMGRKRAAQDLIETLGEVPWWMEKWPLHEALKSLPTMGPVMAGKILDLVRVNRTKTLLALSERQREDVCELVDIWATKRWRTKVACPVCGRPKSPKGASCRSCYDDFLTGA